MRRAILLAVVFALCATGANVPQTQIHAILASVVNCVPVAGLEPSAPLDADVVAGNLEMPT
jgi:hypothetical protein